MKILVSIKRVPEVHDADVEIARDGRSIETEDLSFDLGEWDACAVETAVRLKEEHGGEVTAITVGDEEAESGLRKALAMGADAAVRVKVDQPLHDPLVVARLVSAWAAPREFDLVLTGVMAADDGYGAVGPALGALLSRPHASMVVELTIEEGVASVTRELEEGLKETLLVPLPAVLCAQTGLAEPRYVSIMGIRRVRRIPIEAVTPEELGAGPQGRIDLLELARPAAGRNIELLEGSVRDVAARVAALVGEATR